MSKTQGAFFFGVLVFMIKAILSYTYMKAPFIASIAAASSILADSLAGLFPLLIAASHRARQVILDLECLFELLDKAEI